MARSFVWTVLILLAAGCASAANGPIDKGSLYLGGSFFFQSQGGDLYENSEGDGITVYGAGDLTPGIFFDFEVAPTIGYFIAPGIFLGAQAAVFGISLGDEDGSIVAFGPTFGYYFNLDPTRTNPSGAVYPYLQGFVNYGHADLFLDADIWQYGGKGGMLYMLSSAVGADAAVLFQKDSWTIDDVDESITGTTISIGVGITAFI